MVDVASLPKFLPDSMLLAVLVIALCGCADAASLLDTRETMDATGLSDATVISILSIASCICLTVAVVGCAWCCKTGFAKFEDTTTETNVVGQNYTSFSDFSPPTMSTPSRPPGASEPETVTIEPLPQLPGRTSNQWVNVLRVGGAGGLDPGQTVQSIKLIDSPRFQFPRSQISYVDEMGNGWFGKVLQGEAQRMHPGLRKTRVVIKQLRDTATPEEQLLFLQEVQPYREVNHPNVLLLLGQCIDSMPLLLILEYAPFGDLKSYLRKHRTETQEMAHQDIQLKMAADIVSGLMWLHQADFIYFDLATRNCQVSADTSVKIGDYGLALEKYPDDYYITKDNSQAIPIRWLGPEVIELSDDDAVKTKTITKESNVWSFGIMMLELSTGAKRPYAKLTDKQVLQQVVKEQEIRVDKPNLSVHYAARWFEIMMYCWLEADIRPTMKELHDLIMYLKNNRDRIDMPDFEAHWNSIKPAALHESSESSKEEEEGPPLPVPKNPLESGFQDDFMHPLTTEMQSSGKQTDTPVIEPPPSKLDSRIGGFDSDFGAVSVASAVQAAPVITNALSLNRNMNAETSAPDDQPLFDDDFVTAVRQPKVESVPQPDLVDQPVDGFQSDFVTQTEVPATQSVPLFPEVDGGVELRDSTPKKAPCGLESDLVPSPASIMQASLAVSIPTPDLFDKPPHPQDKDTAASASRLVPDVQRTSTPVAGEVFETSANISVLSPPVDEGPNNFISTASMSFSRTPAPNDVSISFHSAVSPDSEDQTQFLSFNTINTTPSTNYQTANEDQTQPSIDNDTFDTVTSEEPTFIIIPDTAPVDARSSFLLSTPADHSPTEFTGFVTAELPSAVEQPLAAVSSNDAAPLGLQMDSEGETDGSLVVEPPGDETMGQSGLWNFTDSNLSTPQQLSSNTSDVSLLPSSTTLQTVNSPFTITMSAQGADQQQGSALSVHSESGGVSTSRTVTSSSSSSTRVVKTMRTARQVQIVGGEEIVTVGKVTTPEDDGAVSTAPGSNGDGTVLGTRSGSELQTSSSTQQMSSYQSAHQTSSSSMMKEASSSGQLASFTITPGGEMTSNNGTMSVTRQMSGESSSSSSTSVTRHISSQKVSSFQTSGEATTMIRQMSGESSSSSSMVREFSSSSSSSSSLTAASSGEVVTSLLHVGSESTPTLQQLTGNALSKQTGSGEMTFAVTGDNNAAVSEQSGSSSSMSSVGHSSSSQSLTRSEALSEVVSSSEQGGDGQSNVTVSRSMSATKSQQQSSSVQLINQTSGDAKLPVPFDLSSLGLGAPNGGSLVEGEPGTTVEKMKVVSTGPGQMSMGQAMTMQGGGSAVGEMENGAQVSVQWQGSAAMKQEHSVFSSEVTSDGSAGLVEGLPGQSNQLAFTSPEGDSSGGN